VFNTLPNFYHDHHDDTKMISSRRLSVRNPCSIASENDREPNAKDNDTKTNDQYKQCHEAVAQGQSDSTQPLLDVDELEVVSKSLDTSTILEIFAEFWDSTTDGETSVDETLFSSLHKLCLDCETDVDGHLDMPALANSNETVSPSTKNNQSSCRCQETTTTTKTIELKGIGNVSSSMQAIHRHNPWSTEEDDQLRQAIKSVGGPPYPWKTISSQYFDGLRTVAMCKSRWLKVSHIQFTVQS
jgi:hypothetical protein